MAYASYLSALVNLPVFKDQSLKQIEKNQRVLILHALNKSGFGFVQCATGSVGTLKEGSEEGTVDYRDRTIGLAYVLCDDDTPLLQTIILAMMCNVWESEDPLNLLRFFELTPQEQGKIVFFASIVRYHTEFYKHVKGRVSEELYIFFKKCTALAHFKAFMRTDQEEVEKLCPEGLSMEEWMLQIFTVVQEADDKTAYKRFVERINVEGYPKIKSLIACNQASKMKRTRSDL